MRSGHAAPGVFYFSKSNYSADSYILNTNYMTRDKAQAWCNDNAAHLVSYNSSAEQKEIEMTVGAVLQHLEPCHDVTQGISQPSTTCTSINLCPAVPRLPLPTDCPAAASQPGSRDAWPPIACLSLLLRSSSTTARSSPSTTRRTGWVCTAMLTSTPSTFGMIGGSRARVQEATATGALARSASSTVRWATRA